jgi:hypothetical protein
MEDLFQILIWLFIIISFLSSIFKKKKKEIPPQKPPQRREEVRTPSTQTGEAEEYDILKEIEGLFKTESPTRAEPTVEKTPTSSRDYQTGQRVETADEHFGTDPWHARTESEHTINEQWKKHQERMQAKTSKIDKMTEERAKKFERMLQSKTVIKHDRSYLISKNILEKLQKPDTLSEYIIFSEILGKPKALRRR